MYPCFGGPLDGRYANTGKDIRVVANCIVVEQPYRLREYAWNDGGRVHKTFVYQHEGISDQEVIDCMNAQLNLIPVEKKS
ncbi:hypothetical protein vBAbaMD22_110 [Acinetobacter phage vB_AbaM_D22]|nr:hypothetical protein vBAbaMD22_110 [Acinetobacter phage vB_AbaM_D22]